MIPPVVVVDPWRTAELRTQNHQRLLQQSLGIGAFQEDAYRLIQANCLPWRPLEVVAVGVPAAHPSPSQQARDYFLMIVQSIVLVDRRFASELSAQHHQRLVQQPLGLVDGQHGARRLVQDGRMTLCLLEVVAVGVRLLSRHSRPAGT